jgi:hypothetical protein
MDATLVLLLIATVFFAVASLGVRAPVHFGWAGAALVSLALVLGTGF